MKLKTEKQWEKSVSMKTSSLKRSMNKLFSKYSKTLKGKGLFQNDSTKPKLLWQQNKIRLKKKFQACLPDKYRGKNSQPNTRKLNPAAHQKDHSQ